MEAWQLRGDQAALAELFARHYPGIARFFHNKVSEPAQDDLTNDTFLACLRSLPHFRGHANFRTFLYKIARNVLVDHIRRLKIPAVRLDSETDVDETPDDSPDTSPIENAAQREQQQALLKALRRIPQIHKDVLELYYWKGLTAAEISDMLGIPIDTAKTRLRDGREHLRKQKQLRELATSPTQTLPGGREDEPDEDEPDEDEPDEDEPDED